MSQSIVIAARRPVIEIEGVTKSYALGTVTVQALRDITLTIDGGEMLCIMGKSGSGKSTLLRQLSLIDRPTSGRITLEGRDVLALSEGKRSAMRLARLGYVFQEYALIPELTAQENVSLPAMMLGARPREYRARAAALLEQVGMGERLHHRPKELSGGEQQRVAIARALVNNPAIVYADEPTANLDSVSGRARPARSEHGCLSPRRVRYPGAHDQAGRECGHSASLGGRADGTLEGSGCRPD